VIIAGYFDTEAEFKPLLHLWSLAIEEQFYIIWPAVLWLCHKTRPSILFVTLIIAAASFILNLEFSISFKMADFYLPVSRFWELLSGTLLAIINADEARHRAFRGFAANWPRPRGWNLKGLASVSGLVLICAGLVLIDRSAAFPGWRAVLPVLGAVLLIAAGPASALNRSILGHPILVCIGLISYPLYLWHWPILVFTRLIAPDVLTISGRFILLAFAFLLALLTYRFIELPVRTSKLVSSSQKRIFLGACIAALLAFCILGLEIRYRDIQSPLQRLTDVAFQYKHNRVKNHIEGSSRCLLRDNQKASEFEKRNCWVPPATNRPSVLLLGDSHSDALYSGLEGFFAQHGIPVSQYSAILCPPLTPEHSDSRCEDIDRFILASVKSKKPDIVIFFAHYLTWSKGFSASENYPMRIAAKAGRLASLGAGHIVVVGQIPVWDGGLPALIERNFIRQRRSVPMRTQVGLGLDSLEMDHQLRSQSFGDRVTYISLQDHLCDSEGCLTRVGDRLEKDLLVYDYGHLTRHGAEYITRLALAPILERLIQDFEHSR
jgi:hypothetical protein